jgi:hypothetical protein
VIPSSSTLVDGSSSTLSIISPVRNHHPVVPPAIMQPQHQQHPASREAYAFPSHSSDGQRPPISPQISHPRQQPPLTRHESYPYPFTSVSPSADTRNRPPLLRAAQSAYTPRGSGRQMDEMSTNADEDREGGKRGIVDVGDVEELTTKGRKRKRLAKACSACHVSPFSR